MIPKENALLICMGCGNDASESESGKLLRCYEKGCPVCVHERCTKMTLQFDDEGNFFCPYCAYKLMMNVQEKLDKKLDQSAAKLSEWINTAEDSRMDYDAENGERNVASGKRKFENVEGGDSRESLEVEPVRTVRLLDIKAGKLNGDEGVEDGEKVAEESTKSPIFDESMRVTLEALERKNKRVLWSDDEVQALKEGVRDLWTPEKRKNIPWEKICIAYKDRFHSSRTAENLKDKWKSLAKAYCSPHKVTKV